MGVEPATFLRWAVKRGADGLMVEQACEAYRRGEATLSRAAELAGISLRDFVLRLRANDLELRYGPAELEEDLVEAAGKP
jgi:predicted HTH domain antitoxin